MIMKMKKTVGLVLMSALLLAGCSNGSTAAQGAEGAQGNQQPQQEAGGKIAVSGSTSTEKIIKALADEYSALCLLYTSRCV